MMPRSFPSHRRSLPVLALVAPLLIASTASAQRSPQEWMDRCEEQGDSRREVHCEVRPFELPATGELEIDASPNGGIEVEGWDRNQVSVVALVRAYGETEAEARELASEVRVRAEAGRVESEGPDTRGRRGWSVSYQVRVPRGSDLDLESTNGGISVRDVTGTMELSTTNGGLVLERVAGDVRGETVNGGLRVELTGDRWQGSGLSLETTNGGVDVFLPSGYNARLEAGTVNGGLSTDFPVTVQGRIGRRVEAQLGEGGPPLRIRTTNGSIELHRR